MQFLTAAAILNTIFVLAHAAPTPPQSPNNPGVIFRRGAKSVNDCGPSTFENNSSGGSPLISDCQIIAKNIAGGGTWDIEAVTKEFHQLVQFGTCAFGVSGDGEINGINMGNQDIIDLINSSIEQFAWEGLVGASGQTTCQSDKGEAGLETPANWAIYHNAE